MLRYKKLHGGVLEIDLHNKYIVMIVMGYTPERNECICNCYLREQTVQMWDLINHEKTENVSFFVKENANMESQIAQYITQLASENFFDEYIKRYEYYLKCVDAGVDQLEKLNK